MRLVNSDVKRGSVKKNKRIQKKNKFFPPAILFAASD